LLYAVGVGAGSIDPTGFELQFTTENSKDIQQRVLPTFAVIVGMGIGDVGTFNPAMLVHGEQAIELHREIPVEGKALTSARVVAVYDKGSAAVVVNEATSVDAATGEPLMTTRNSMFIRGEGGFGGDRGPSGPRNVAPDREPDEVVTYQTRPDQALTYRLSGDRNPLHSDPEFAKMGGFDRPILHGLCSFGIVCKAIVDAALGGDPTRVARYSVRFAGVAFPGETLRTSWWREDGKLLIDVASAQRGAPIISNAAIELRT
jgi:acyl dehydratase